MVLGIVAMVVIIGVVASLAGARNRTRDDNAELAVVVGLRREELASQERAMNLVILAESGGGTSSFVGGGHHSRNRVQLDGRGQQQQQQTDTGRQQGQQRQQQQVQTPRPQVRAIGGQVLVDVPQGITQQYTVYVSQNGGNWVLMGNISPQAPVLVIFQAVPAAGTTVDVKLDLNGPVTGVTF